MPFLTAPPPVAKTIGTVIVACLATIAEMLSPSYSSRDYAEVVGDSATSTFREKRDTKNGPWRQGPEMNTSMAQFRTRRPSHICEMPR